MFSSQKKGIVCGILSGDSVVVRFVDKTAAPIEIICLENLIAPKYGRTDGVVKDEPYGFASWSFLRDLCLNKRVLVPERRPINQERIHPAFGPLPVIFTRIKIANTDIDVGIEACKAGMVKLRENSRQTQTSPYYSELQHAQEEAQENKRGIWSDEPGFVRKLPVPINVEDILARKELECNVEGILNATTLSLFVLPTHENIILTFAGVKADKEASEELKNLAKVDTRNKYLNRKIHVRISQFNQDPHIRHNTIPSFIGSIIDEPLLHAVEHSVEKGYAIYNDKNYDFCPNVDRILMKQKIAQDNKCGFWATHEPRPFHPLNAMEGIITSIKGSDAFNIMVEGKNHIIHLNSVQVPRYSNLIGNQAGGFEAREFLRKKYINKYVAIDIEGQTAGRVYGTVSMKGVSINEDLAAHGLAKYIEPILGVESSHKNEIIKAEEQAKNNKLGIWSDDLKNYEVQDYATLQCPKEASDELVGKKFTCIIEHILSSTRYTILIPEKQWLVRVALNGLVTYSANDRFGKEARKYCLEHILQTEVEIEFKSVESHPVNLFWVEIKGANGQSISADLLLLGFTEIHKKFLASNEPEIQYMKDAQDAAKARSNGIWSDHTRHHTELTRGTSYKVSVCAVITPTTLVARSENEVYGRVKQLLKIPSNKITEPPMKNDCLVCNIEENRFRACIETINVNERNAKVKLIDHQQECVISFDDLYELSDELRAIPPQARVVTLAGLVEPEKLSREEFRANCNSVWKVVNEAYLYMQVVADDGVNPPSVVLLDREELDSAVPLSVVLTQNKIAKYVEGEYPPEFKRIFEQIKLAGEAAQ